MCVYVALLVSSVCVCVSLGEFFRMCVYMHVNGAVNGSHEANVGNVPGALGHSQGSTLKGQAPSLLKNFYFWPCWVLLLRGPFSSWGERGLLSSCSAQVSPCTCAFVTGRGLQRACASVAAAPGLSGWAQWLLCGMWDLPQTRDGAHVSCVDRRILYQ